MTDTPDEPRGGYLEPRDTSRYRRRLRETEQERDQLAAILETSRRREVQALCQRHRVTPEAVFAVCDLDALLTDGHVDPDKVDQAARTARTELGIDSGLYVPGEGHNPSGTSRGAGFPSAFGRRS